MITSNKITAKRVDFKSDGAFDTVIPGLILPHFNVTGFKGNPAGC